MRWSLCSSAATSSSAASGAKYHTDRSLEELELNDEELLRLIRVAVEAAEDRLGQDTEAFFVGEIMGITEWFIVTSGSNARQVRAIVDEIEEQVAKAGGAKPNRIEGKDSMSWVLMDYGSFVAHVFSSEARDYYDLERLWKDVPRLSDVA